MDVYFISILIIGAVIFVKVMVIICIYACKAKRQRQQRSGAATPATGQDSGAYPHDPHTQRSAIINFEETPQPIINVPPGADPNTLNPMLAPPPYSIVTQGLNKDDKPPAYEQIMQDGEPPPFGVHYAEPASNTLPQEPTEAVVVPSQPLPPPQPTENTPTVGSVGLNNEGFRLEQRYPTETIPQNCDAPEPNNDNNHRATDPALSTVTPPATHENQS